MKNNQPQQKRFYIDTSIWRDYFEGRGDGIRPLGEFAFQFLRNCIENECLVLCSNLVVSELRKEYSEEKLLEAFSYVGKFLVRIGISDSQINEAKRKASCLPETHYSDVLHAIVARDSGAVLIARDCHFECLGNLVDIMKPEEVIFD